MDTYCTHCREPWDLDYLRHDITDPKAEGFVFGRHRAIVLRCPSCQHARRRCASPRFRTLVTALGDLLGDDADGLAAEIDDLAYLFPCNERPLRASRMSRRIVKGGR